MRGSSRPDWRTGKRRYVVHFSTGDAAMHWYDEQLEIGSGIESGTCEVWRVAQPHQIEELGRTPGRN